jgi:hypothetical protein
MAKGIHTGIIELDENGNYFCGSYLLDYQMVAKSFKLGDKITIKTVIVNPSDKSFPEAILVSNQRKVGRPKKNLSQKKVPQL